MGLIPDKNRVKRLKPENPNADAYVTPATLPVLFCICNRWPIPFNFAQHCTAARHLMGKTLSDWLSVPRTTFRDEVEYKIGMTLANLPSLFARNYRRGWDAKRRDAMRRSVESAVRYELGNRMFHLTITRKRPNRAKGRANFDQEARMPLSLSKKEMNLLV